MVAVYSFDAKSPYQFYLKKTNGSSIIQCNAGYVSGMVFRLVKGKSRFFTDACTKFISDGAGATVTRPNLFLFLL